MVKSFFVLIILPIYLLLFFVLMLTIAFSKYSFKRIKILTLKEDKEENLNENVYFSIIIPVRNEEENIKKILNDIINQSYKNFEVIIVNDHSEDSTIGVIESLKDRRIKIIHLKNGEYGKKNAILNGLNFADGEYIILIDADIKINNNWLKSYAKKIKSNFEFIIGIVLPILKGNDFFQFFQFIEYTCMQFFNIGFSFYLKPFLCSSANLCIKKSVFKKIKNEIKVKIPSGDDVFLLHAYLKNYNKFCINNYKESIVYFYQKDKILEFLHQRLRWASKAKHYKNFFAIFFSFLIYFFSFTFLIFFVLTIFNFNLFYLIILVTSLYLLTKQLYSFLILCFNKLELNFNFSFKRLFSFVLLFLVYTFFIGTYSFVYNVKWKGRHYF